MKKKLLALILTLAMLLPLLPAGSVFAEGETPEIYGTSLFLENNIAINFVIDAEAFTEAGFTSPQVVFTFEGNNTTVTDYVEKNGFYYFTFHGINANRMGKTVVATPSAMKDGVRVTGETKEESVLSYCRRALAETPYEYETLPTLIVDLLTYGAKSQIYFNYDAENLVTAPLDAGTLALGTDTVPAPVSVQNTAYAVVPDPEVTWYGAYLRLEDSIKLQFIFDCDDTSGLTIELRDDLDRVVASFDEDDAEDYGGHYRINCDTITPDRMQDALYLTAYREAGDELIGENELPFVSTGNGAVSNTLRYSIASYVVGAREQYEGQNALQNLLNAMLNYGASTAAYVDEVRNYISVPEPAETPVYTFDHTPTEAEMRAMAVKAMRDELSVQWYTPVDIHFSKGGAAAGEYVYDAGRLYGGMPYTSAGIGLFQFLDYYNSRTGKLLYTDSETFNDTIGNTCGSSAVWALFSVCTSLRGLCTSKNLTKENGFIPLGNLDYDDSITEFNATNSTKRILQDYFTQTVYQAYAQVKPGDLLVFSNGGDAAGHTMMAIADAVVIYDSNGNIDPQSYIKIQDQRPDLLEDPAGTGIDISYFGRRSTKFYFSYLNSKGYLPVTTAEFLGTKAYENAALSAKNVNTDAAPAGNVSTQLISSYYLESNYPMALAQFVVNAGTGNERVIQTKYFSRTQVNSGAAFHWQMTDFANPVRNALRDAGYVKDGSVLVKVRVTVSNGEVFTPITFVYS